MVQNHFALRAFAHIGRTFTIYEMKKTETKSVLGKETQNLDDNDAGKWNKKKEKRHSNRKTKNIETRQNAQEIDGIERKRERTGNEAMEERKKLHKKRTCTHCADTECTRVANIAQEVSNF